MLYFDLVIFVHPILPAEIVTLQLILGLLESSNLFGKKNTKIEILLLNPGGNYDLGNWLLNKRIW